MSLEKISFKHSTYQELAAKFGTNNGRFRHHIIAKSENGKIKIYYDKNPENTNFISRFIYNLKNPDANLKVVQRRLNEKCNQLSRMDRDADRNLVKLERALKMGYFADQFNDKNIQKHNDHVWFNFNVIPIDFIKSHINFCRNLINVDQTKEYYTKLQTILTQYSPHSNNTHFKLLDAVQKALHTVELETYIERLCTEGSFQLKLEDIIGNQTEYQARTIQFDNTFRTIDTLELERGVKSTLKAEQFVASKLQNLESFLQYDDTTLTNELRSIKNNAKTMIRTHSDSDAIEKLFEEFEELVKAKKFYDEHSNEPRIEGLNFPSLQNLKVRALQSERILKKYSQFQNLPGLDYSNLKAKIEEREICHNNSMKTLWSHIQNMEKMLQEGKVSEITECSNIDWSLFGPSNDVWVYQQYLEIQALEKAEGLEKLRILLKPDLQHKKTLIEYVKVNIDKIKNSIETDIENLELKLKELLNEKELSQENENKIKSLSHDISIHLINYFNLLTVFNEHRSALISQIDLNVKCISILFSDSRDQILVINLFQAFYEMPQVKNKIDSVKKNQNRIKEIFVEINKTNFSRINIDKYQSINNKLEKFLKYTTAYGEIIQKFYRCQNLMEDKTYQDLKIDFATIAEAIAKFFDNEKTILTAYKYHQEMFKTALKNLRSCVEILDNDSDSIISTERKAEIIYDFNAFARSLNLTLTRLSMPHGRVQ